MRDRPVRIGFLALIVMLPVALDVETAEAPGRLGRLAAVETILAAGLGLAAVLRRGALGAPAVGRPHVSASPAVRCSSAASRLA